MGSSPFRIKSLNLFLDGRGGLAVIAVYKALELLGDHLVALAHDNVEHRLGADDLAGGRDERRVAGILAHARDLGQHVVELVLFTGVP